MRCLRVPLRGAWGRAAGELALSGAGPGRPAASAQALRTSARGRAFGSGSQAVQALEEELRPLGLEVTTTPAKVKAKSRDYYWYSPVLRAALKDCVADCAVAPRSEEEVLRAVGACARLGLPLTPRGSGTGNYGQAVPLSGGVLLDLSRLVGFEELRPGVVRAAAGQRMGEIEAQMRPRGHELRFFPSTVATASIGGFVAGGSTGVGGLRYGTLTEPGNILALRLVTAEQEPRVLELRTQSELLAATHAYGTNGIITSVELALAPATDWADLVFTFPSMETAIRCGFSLAESPGVVLRSLCLLEGGILRLRGFSQLAAEAPEAATCAAALLATAASNSVEAASGLVAGLGGEVALAPPRKHGRPLHEYAWNHTTLRALQADPSMTYQQIGYHFEPDLVENIMHVHKLFEDSGELLTHLEWVRLGSRMGAFGMPLQRYKSEARLNEVIAEVEATGRAFVMNPHTYVLEDGGMKQTNVAQLEFKRQTDPNGLLNPGKMRAYEEGRATGGSQLGFLAERLREGRAIPLGEVAQDLAPDMQETLTLETSPSDANGVTSGGQVQNAGPGALRWGGRARSWTALTHEDFAALSARAVAVLPVGAVEQHGLHLPTGVDAFICQGILQRALELLPEETAQHVVAMPLQAVGTSREHLAFPGSLTISAQAFADLVVELGKSARRAGFGKMLVVNSHGGQVDASNIAARRLRVETGLLCCVLHTFRTWELDGLWPTDEVAYGIHGGGVETSLMMHLQGDLVRRDKLADNPSQALHRHLQRERAGQAPPLLQPHSPGVMYGWMAHDLHSAGAVGDATNADAERGRRVVEGAAAKAAQLLEELVDANVEELLASAAPPAGP